MEDIYCRLGPSYEPVGTDLPERSHQAGLDFIFQDVRLVRKVSLRDLSNSVGTLIFSKWLFLHYNEAEDTVFCHTCMKMSKENKTSTKADPAFVSSA